MDRALPTGRASLLERWIPSDKWYLIYTGCIFFYMFVYVGLKRKGGERKENLIRS